MRDSVLLDGSIQLFYFTDDHPTMPGWFKGMKVVLEERGLFQLQDNCQRLTDLEGGDLQVVTLNASQATKKAGIFLGG